MESLTVFLWNADDTDFYDEVDEGKNIDTDYTDDKGRDMKVNTHSLMDIKALIELGSRNSCNSCLNGTQMALIIMIGAELEQKELWILQIR